MNELRWLVRQHPIVVPMAVIVAVLVGWGVYGAVEALTGDDGTEAATVDVAPDDTDPDGGASDDEGDDAPSETTLAPLPPFDGWVNPASSGRMWSDTVPGVLTFRGNPTRSFYGTGPMPTAPEVLWSYPPGGGGLCGLSIDGAGQQTWCGTGWTGQPAAFEHPDGRTWVVFGAYDYGVHFLDGDTGEQVRTTFKTGDIIKGSVTVDPDGYPLVYTGSRDDYFHILATDRGDDPVELWRFYAYDVSPTLWNNDWDGSALVIDDYLFEGGENSVIHIWKLNRGYDEAGQVTIAPELVFHAPGWDQDLLAAIGDTNVSIENSVAISGNTLWFANSGGLLQGWDITTLASGGTPERTFRYWLGDDTDASVVIDDEGFLYVAVEYERGLERAREVGQLAKIDPNNPEAPVVWSVKEHDYIDGGAWATPALWGDVIYQPFDSGRLIGVDRRSGEILWEKRVSGPAWSSPVVVDDVLVQGDCSGVLRAYDVSDPQVDPPELWQVQLEGCIESTPVVWNGRLYVGTRSGRFYAIGDPASSSAADPGATDDLEVPAISRPGGGD